MSVALVEAEIDRFLVSDRNEVLCIRGKWGVGKTYTWNKLLRRGGVSGRAALKSYAYVSLFGVNSLDQLKYSIFENTVAVKDAGVEPIRAAWRHYHDSFDNNEQQVVDALLAALHNEVRFISPMNLGGLVSLLRGLSRDREATEVICYYMESRRDEDRKFFDLSEYAFGDDVTDPEVRAAFDARYQVFSDNRSPVDVLRHIAEHQSWGRNDN